MGGTFGQRRLVWVYQQSVHGDCGGNLHVLDDLRVLHGRKIKSGPYSQLDHVTFIEKAARIGFVSPETAQRCQLMNSSSLVPGDALTTLPEDISAGEQFEGEWPCTDNESMSWVSAPSRPSASYGGGSYLC